MTLQGAQGAQDVQDVHSSQYTQSAGDFKIENTQYHLELYHIDSLLLVYCRSRLC